MATSNRVDPDLQFIKEVTSSGGDTLKKCYQCATCSTVCPISPDDKPFPRKEMIWAQWGLKDKLVKDPDVWLCHQCSDCTAYCPRGAKPGEVMGALRKASMIHYAPIPVIAKLASSFGGMLVLFVIPVVVLLAMLGFNGKLDAFLSGQINPEEGRIVFSYIFPQLEMVDPTFLAAALFAVFSAIVGIKKFWTDINANTTPTANRMYLKSSIIATVKEILVHTKFKECGESKDRLTAHRLVFWAFVGLFIVTNTVLVIHWAHHFGITFLGSDTPLAQSNPVKIIGNISGIALILGILMIIGNRMKAAEQRGMGSFFDWSLIIVIGGVAVTGFLAEIVRLLDVAQPAYFVYFLHLMFVFYLFAFMPYTKFAHIVYRTAALVYVKYTGREVVAEPSVDYQKAEAEEATA